MARNSKFRAMSTFSDFSQKQREFTVSAKISDAFLEYHLKKFGQEVQAFIPYEDLTSDIIGKTDKKPLLLLLSAICLLGFAASIPPNERFPIWPFAFFFGFFTLTLAFAYYWGRHRLLMIKGQKYDVCVLNNKEGRGFLEAVRERRREYLKMMYGRIRWENNTADELNRFRYLHIQGALSDAEFEAVRIELLNK